MSHRHDFRGSTRRLAATGIVAYRRLQKFMRADHGNVAMIFALTLIPVCIAAGAGLDAARAYGARRAVRRTGRGEPGCRLRYRRVAKPAANARPELFRRELPRRQRLRNTGPGCRHFWQW